MMVGCNVKNWINIYARIEERGEGEEKKKMVKIRIENVLLYSG